METGVPRPGRPGWRLSDIEGLCPIARSIYSCASKACPGTLAALYPKKQEALDWLTGGFPTPDRNAISTLIW